MFLQTLSERNKLLPIEEAPTKNAKNITATLPFIVTGIPKTYSYKYWLWFYMYM